MREHWDAIVIGAGRGRLTAAAHLVKAGLRVLVLERNSPIGGTAYVYHRKGFTFPTGPLGFSHTGLVKTILEDLKVGEGLQFSRFHYRLRALGVDLPHSGLPLLAAMWGLMRDESLRPWRTGSGRPRLSLKVLQQ